MKYVGHFPISNPALKKGRHSEEARPWRVIKDPSRAFLSAQFRTVDLISGGFDQGTIFQHIKTGERRVTDRTGIARAIQPARRISRRAARRRSNRRTHAIH
ncbi:MAG TPA: hypothetical protein PLV64_22415 [Anaerolineales bacterium]|nr:hypothetical protein [Anaerolineales bacterium]